VTAIFMAVIAFINLVYAVFAFLQWFEMRNSVSVSRDG